MSTGRRLGIMAVGLLVGLAPLAVAEPAGAAKKPAVTAHGYWNCTMTGSVSYSPALTTTPASTSARVRAKVLCPGASSGPFDPFATGLPASPNGWPDQRILIEAGSLSGQSAPYVASCQQPHPRSLALAIKWRPDGGRAVPTLASFGPATGGASPITHRFQSFGVAGSYESQTVTATFPSTTSAAACSATKLKRFRFSNAPLRFAGCGRNIPVEFWPAQSLDGGPSQYHVWWVVVPNVTYEPPCHPTGTMSITHPLPQCPNITTGPVQDSTAQAAGFGVFPSSLWGRSTGRDLAAFTPECARGFTLRYSGDATYRPLTLSF